MLWTVASKATVGAPQISKIQATISGWRLHSTLLANWVKISGLLSLSNSLVCVWLQELCLELEAT